MKMNDLRFLIVIMVVISTFLLLSGCSKLKPVQPAEPIPKLENTAVPVSVVTEEVPAKVGCEKDADCLEGQLCIDGTCGTIADLYSTNCTNLCNYDGADILTSDGQSFTIKKGQGSYTLAGAIEWKLLSVPDYCPMDNFIVPIKLIMKSTGKILLEKVVTVKINEESEVITHPLINKEFTLTVKKVEEVCK